MENLKLIYQGNKSHIYQDLRPGREGIAIKMLKEPDPSAQQLAYLKNEYTITQDLEMEGVRKVLEEGEIEGRPAIFIEFVEGESIKQVLIKERKSLEEMLGVAIEASKVLSEIHISGVIHRDLSSNNILVYKEGKSLKVKFIDFAFARKIEPKGIDATGLEGTLAYISPEQSGRTDRKVDFRSDLYALGITFYELFTGHLPFQQTEPTELVHAHIAQKPTPPHEVEPSLPPQLSRIILKLIAKDPDDRYQTANGLLKDLENCLEMLREAGEINSFKLGVGDRMGIFKLSNKLYGREPEMLFLRKTYDRIALGTMELLLFKGYAGAGKSSLANELGKYIRAQGGYYAKGAFSQGESTVPYEGTNHAFQDLTAQMLTESSRQLESWKRKILAAVGQNGGILTEFIPDLELIIGKQPAPLPLEGASENQNRLRITFLNFLKALSDADHPLVIYLDDCQWADEDSVDLIRLLMTDSNNRNLWLIAGLKEEDINKEHPFMKMVDYLRKQEVIVEELTIGNLESGAIAELISESLNCNDESCVSLAEVVYAKTQGSPFFVRQMLSSIHESGLLYFDQRDFEWKYDLNSIQQLNITDNVVELMAAKIQRLPKITQDILKKAGGIGNRFSLGMLRQLYELPPDEMIGELNLAIREGLIADMTSTQAPTDLIYGFSHDRIREAVYSLIEESERPALHLNIGREMLKSYPEADLAEAPNQAIFDLVNQWNRALPILQNREDHRTAARLNLQAAKRSNASTAYKSALYYCERGLELLSAYGWEANYRLNYELSSEALQATFLERKFSLLIDISNRLINQSVNLEEKTTAYELQIQALIAQNKLSRAFEIGLRFLKQLGIEFPERSHRWARRKVLFKTWWLFRGKDSEDLIRLAEMKDPLKLATQRILAVLSPIVHLARPELAAHIPYAQAALSLKHGNSPISAMAYVNIGILFSQVFKNHNKGYELGQLGIQLLNQFPNNEYKARTHLAFYNELAPASQSIKACLEPLKQIYYDGRTIGDLTTAGFGINQYLTFSFFAGKPLQELEKEAQIYMGEARQGNQNIVQEYLKLNWQFFLQLHEFSDTPTQINGRAGREAEILRVFEAGNDQTGIFTLHLYKLILCYLFGEHEEAQLISHQLETNRSGINYYYLALADFYEALNLLQLYTLAEKKTQKKYFQRIEDLIDRLDEHAEYAPINHLHKLFLVEAEKHRVLGEEDDARRMYEKALQLARYNEFLNDEVLIWELLGKFYRQLGNSFLAEGYLSKAWKINKNWGSDAKADYLEKRYPHFIGKAKKTSSQSTMGTRSASSGDMLQGLDLESITKASLALSSEIVLSNLLEKMMHIVMENAGAQTGAFIENQDGKLFLIVHGNAGESIQVREALPLEEVNHVSTAIVNFVARTRKELVMANASGHSKFEKDPYIQEVKPKSLLCYPLVHKRKLIGIIYLENNLTEGAFTADRIEILNVLSSQICISIDNAHLYESLDEKVRLRTAELNQKNVQLNTTLGKLKNTQSKLVSSEKMASLGQLTAGIAHEINNPVNFISGNIGPLTRDIEDIKELFLLVKDLESPENLRDKLTKIKDFRDEIEADFLFEEIELLLKGIKDGAIRTKEIVLGLKNFSRLDEQDFKMADVHEGIDSTLTLLNNKLKNRIEVIRDYDLNLPRIECLPGKLNQVFMNILNNAMDAMEDTGEIHISTKQQGDKLEIRMRDTGSGMPPEVAEHIFEPFFTTKDVGAGTGLGLSISYGIIQQHKGNIRVESTPGEGTEFIIEIPMEQSVGSRE